MKNPFVKAKTHKEVLVDRLYQKLVDTSEVEEFKQTLDLLERVNHLDDTKRALNPAVINGAVTLISLGAILAIEVGGHTITSKGYSLLGKRFV